MKEKFLKICREHIHRNGIDNLLSWLEKSDFYTAPASTRFHGNYKGGLIEHSLNVYECLKKLNQEKGFPYSDETIATVSLFHDICKVNCYKISQKNVKDPDTGRWHTVDYYTRDSSWMPLGHGEKSCIILQRFLKKLTVEEIIAIRWHMGGFDSAVRGGDYDISSAYDQYPLAVMLHIADMEATYFMEGRGA